MYNNTLIVIAGPTAVGKTELAIKVARHFKTEIISADSRQLYKEMSIGTAKPSQAELDEVKHHFIGSLSVADEYSAGDYQTEALKKLDEIFHSNRFAVLAGGSGLFIKAITEGFDDLPKASPEIRDDLNRMFANEGIDSLQERLSVLDPEYYSKVDLSNPQRIIRALEVTISTGRPFSSFHIRQAKERPFNMAKIGLNLEREYLYQRINQRVDSMIAAGLVKEVENLLPFRHLNALNTVGYSELFDFFDNRISLEEAINKIKQNTRRFAKRQLTWFRKDPEINWFEPTQLADILHYIEQKSN